MSAPPNPASRGGVPVHAPCAAKVNVAFGNLRFGKGMSRAGNSDVVRKIGALHCVNGLCLVARRVALFRGTRRGWTCEDLANDARRHEQRRVGAHADLVPGLHTGLDGTPGQGRAQPGRRRHLLRCLDPPETRDGLTRFIGRRRGVRSDAAGSQRWRCARPWESLERSLDRSDLRV